MNIPEILKSDDITVLKKAIEHMHEINLSYHKENSKLQKEISKGKAERHEQSLDERISLHIKNEAEDTILYELINPIKDLTDALSFINIKESDEELEEVTRPYKILSIIGSLKHIRDHISYSIKVLESFYN